ncbi:coproporphyrinogen dehydrogenase HemZ [Desulfallas sp. Bu1-1]|uniref:coproporphyrinogen dehydrogenase HemZ n=1 Tax=Desulfallas sp. Bu1-1 TaxID=2787620 RepID=UPI00189CED6B|nr:coproporphyrinogen dehydrogenase HemZ [Desulfallas sp. Bu1-1]MBF7084040.1 coproporphyrinogen dehydrogenase HemZ [Desulfallas sp. Bu1-1]
MIIGINAPDACRPGIEDIIRVFYRGFEIKPAAPGAGHDIEITLSLEQSDGYLLAAAGIQSANLERTHMEKEPVIPGSDLENESKRLARLAVYRLLEGVKAGCPTPWGIMTGIRPTKVVHRIMDGGLAPEGVIKALTEKFAVTPEKAALITEIALHQRPFLPAHPGTSREIGVYAGIPFCPSRCLYCSFPAYPREKYRHWVAPYVNALLQEIKAVGEAVKAASLNVRCIYLGGGTPTCLEPAQLAAVLEALNQNLPVTADRELTVEGGRPETLSAEVIDIIRAAGATRLSINPQTMQERTLRVIGRHHTVRDVMDAMERARSAGLETINMDIIAGLPGETAGDMRDTLGRIAALRPENLSVHTLAVKRAARLSREIDQYPLPSPGSTGAMLEEARRRAGLMGMVPYYMYRQKNMLGNLENIGYALPGRECLYNIMIMEERHSIIGLGAGAGSKYVMPGGMLYNRYNPKDPRLYVERLEEIIQKKKRGIAALNRA